MEYQDVFSRDAQDLCCTSLVQHSINTADSPPIKQPHRRVLLAKRKEMKRIVEEMAAQGIVEHSDSPWLSLVLQVNKKDGTQCFCVDYMALNNVTVNAVWVKQSAWMFRVADGKGAGRVAVEGSFSVPG